MMKIFSGLQPDDIEHMDPDDLEDLKTMATWNAINNGVDVKLVELWYKVK